MISAPRVRSRKFDRNARINGASLKTGTIMEIDIENLRLNFSFSDNAPKSFLETKWLLDTSLRRIEFNKSKRINSYDHKNHRRSSDCTILYAGVVTLCTGTPGASRARES